MNAKNQSAEASVFVELMERVHMVFGGAMSSLPSIFGVSRQTLYDWVKGELPKEKHREKIRQLANAAFFFETAGFTPTSERLDRTVMSGQSFVDLLKHNADGASSANKLLHIVAGGAQERKKLDSILKNRILKPLNASDVGRTSSYEHAVELQK